jgi:hypothetical protein
VIALSMAAQTWSPSNEAPRPVTWAHRTDLCLGGLPPHSKNESVRPWRVLGSGCARHCETLWSKSRHRRCSSALRFRTFQVCAKDLRAIAGLGWSLRKRYGPVGALLAHRGESPHARHEAA